MAKTFVGTYTTPQTLSNPAADNPAIVTGTISVSSAGQVALYGSAGNSWTVNNLGTIESTGSAGMAVDLASGGLVVNGTVGSATPLILGNRFGIRIDAAAGTVDNFGTVRSTSSGSGAAIYLGQGGTVTNETTGLISSNRNGIAVHGSTATIANFGTISHTGAGTEGEAIYLGAGGSIANYGLITGSRPGYTPSSYPGAITVHNQPATVRNLGTITNPNNSNGINLGAGGTVINGAPGTITSTISAPHNALYVGGTLGTPVSGAAGFVFNYGTIANTTTQHNAVLLVSGGSVLNRGLISSPRTGVGFANIAGTIDNFGSIVSTATAIGVAAYLGGGGTLINEAGGVISSIRNAVSANLTATLANSGRIQNTGTNAAIYLRGGGLVTNSSGGMIQSARTGISFNNTVGTTPSIGTVLNAGSIISTATGTTGSGVYLGQGGTLTNQTGGLITAYRAAISVARYAGTISNDGTVQSTGTSASSVLLSAGGTVVNAAGALITSARNGVAIAGTLGTVTNFGTIRSSAPLQGAGIELGAGGQIFNQVGGTISAVRHAVGQGAPAHDDRPRLGVGPGHQRAAEADPPHRLQLAGQGPHPIADREVLDRHLSMLGQDAGAAAEAHFRDQRAGARIGPELERQPREILRRVKRDREGRAVFDDAQHIARAQCRAAARVERHERQVEHVADVHVADDADQA